MKKTLIALIISVMAISGSTLGDEVGLPIEHFALPAVTGDYLVCIWDESANEGAGAWLSAFESYDHAGSYDFQIPSWNNWYWIGLWDQTTETYVYGKWIGHFLTN